MNKVILIGNLGTDPELYTFENGDETTSFSLATNETYKDEAGEKKTITEWHAVKTFGNSASVANTYLRKGDKVAVEGKIKTRTYRNEAGADIYIKEIIASRIEMLTPKQQENNQ